ncbi:hypothetical protein CUN61_28335 [Pseudomonas arsenicoxydans]|uniref:Rap1a immunity protein domain-containing protein n=2 Tax=Pseudomonas arsenicoxydans TaxID=702115 RepID=A0A4P6GCZ9_9PSED|nr:hypothetical protein CUN61_28335 [Pseudomonas arsenicoxydans]
MYCQQKNKMDIKKMIRKNKIMAVLVMLFTTSVLANDFSRVVDSAVSAYYEMGEANVATMSGRFSCEETIAFAMFVDMQRASSGLPSQHNEDAEACIKRRDLKAKYVHAFLGYLIVYKEPGWIK